MGCVGSSAIPSPPPPPVASYDDAIIDRVHTKEQKENPIEDDAQSHISDGSNGESFDEGMSETYDEKTTKEEIKEKKEKKEKKEEKSDLEQMVESLYSNDYALFLSGSLDKKWFCKVKLLYEFFDNNKITRLPHANKYQIMEMIKKINKRESNKSVYFYGNVIDADVLYKKITFARKELFIPFDLYATKQMEYKIKSFCQIVERLGVDKIKITYHSNFGSSSDVQINMKGFNVDAKLEKRNKEEKSDELSIILNYQHKSDKYPINLNKYTIKSLIDKENTFIVSKDEFDADLDLQYLIDSRCDNFVTDYNTTFKINRINEFECSIFLAAEEYGGLHLSQTQNKNEYIMISIAIKFIDVYQNTKLLDGTNTSNDAHGFTNLCNIINDELKTDKKAYIKLNNFLGIYIKSLASDTYKGNLMFRPFEKRFMNDKYYDVIYTNFNKEDRDDLFMFYFKDNLTWDTFANFRSTIVRGIFDYNSVLSHSSLHVIKFNFICFQMNDIYYQQELLYNTIEKLVSESINGTCTLNPVYSKTYTRYHLLDIYEEDKLKNLGKYIFSFFLRSYQYKNGIAYSINETPKLEHEMSVVEIIDYDDKEMIDTLLKEKDFQIKQVYLTIESIMKRRYPNDRVPISLNDLLDFTKIITELVVKDMNRKVESKSKNFDTCSHEVNGIYQLSRIVDLVKDLIYMCIRDPEKYKPFEPYMPNRANYNIPFLRKAYNLRVRIMIEDMFYNYFVIERLFSSYRFYKIYLTFEDFLAFLKYVDKKLSELSDHIKKEKGYTEKQFEVDIIKVIEDHAEEINAPSNPPLLPVLPESLKLEINQLPETISHANYIAPFKPNNVERILRYMKR